LALLSLDLKTSNRVLGERSRDVCGHVGALQVSAIARVAFCDDFFDGHQKAFAPGSAGASQQCGYRSIDP